MELRILSIKEAFDLYDVLEPHLPSTGEGIEYIRFIVQSMKKKDPRAYLQALVILTGFTSEMIQDVIEDPLLIFIRGLEINQVAFLAEFCGKFKHG